MYFLLEKMTSEEVATAIDSAAIVVQKKEKGHGHKKKFIPYLFHHGDYKHLEEEPVLSKEQLENQITEGKTSSLIVSRADRILDRREAVSEKNETERKLTKQTLQNLIFKKNLEEFNLPL